MHASASRDYVESYVVRTGMLPQLYGFDIEVIEARDEGGLPLSAGVLTNYAWDADAVGLGVNLDGAVQTDWIAEKTSWLANQLFSAGSVVIDALGVLEIATTEA